MRTHELCSNKITQNVNGAEYEWNDIISDQKKGDEEDDEEKTYEMNTRTNVYIHIYSQSVFRWTFDQM